MAREGLTYVIASGDIEWMRWINDHKNDDGSSRMDIVRVHSVRQLEGRRLFSQDRLELTGTWWRRVDIHDLINAFRRIIAFAPPDEVPEQILATIEPIIADWHRAVART